MRVSPEYSCPHSNSRWDFWRFKSRLAEHTRERGWNISFEIQETFFNNGGLSICHLAQRLGGKDSTDAVIVIETGNDIRQEWPHLAGEFCAQFPQSIKKVPPNIGRVICQ